MLLQRYRRALDPALGEAGPSNYHKRAIIVLQRRHVTTPASTTPTENAYVVESSTYRRDSYSNTPPTILDKLPRRLHTQPSHPISLLRRLIEAHFPTHTSITPPSPIVTVHQNFDELGFAPDHPGRSLTDSYYLNSEYMLRTHTSAHEVESYRGGSDRWLLTADVYRRDEIDSSHYPVFHQMEGTQVWPSDQLDGLAELNAKLADRLAACPLIIEDPTNISPSNPYQASHNPEHAAQITQHLKHSLNSLIFRLFGSTTRGSERLRIRWIEAFFPFTTPSYEVEVLWNDQWLELLGSGVVMQKTLDQADVPHKSGWAFGLGLERIAMVLFSIPDIRLFWSTDRRFLDQFEPLAARIDKDIAKMAQGDLTPVSLPQFKSYSRYPPCYKDMSFWLPVDSGHASAGGRGRQWHENDYCEIVREVAGDLVETVEQVSVACDKLWSSLSAQIDDFAHPKTGRKSKCYRLNYRSMDRSLSNDEVNALQDQVISRVVSEMGIEMR